MKTYYALWMPTKKVCYPQQLFALKGRTLCDKFSWGGYHICATIDKQKNIELVYQPVWLGIRRKKARKITLLCEGSNKIGFCIYSFENTSCVDDSFTRALTHKMNPSIYHYIKGAFHEHENHLPSEDSILQPYVSDVEISFEKNEKEILLYYLKQYKDKFEDFILYISLELKAAKENINAHYTINQGINSLALIIDKGNLIKGEFEYYNFLQTNASQQAWIPKELKTTVKESHDTIIKIIDDANVAYNLCTTGLGIKYGRWGIWIGIAGVIVSVISIWISINASESQEINEHTDGVVKENIKRLIDIVDSSKKDLMDILKTDSIHKLQ